MSLDYKLARGIIEKKLFGSVKNGSWPNGCKQNMKPVLAGLTGVQIYPTVTGGAVNELSSAADLKQVRLLQADGKELLRRQLVATQGIQIDISGYAKGTYIIEAITTGGRKVQKVVKM